MVYGIGDLVVFCEWSKIMQPHHPHLMGQLGIIIKVMDCDDEEPFYLVKFQGTICNVAASQIRRISVSEKNV